MVPAKNYLELLNAIEAENLLIKLIEQLNKDFLLSNINHHFELSISTIELKEHLNDFLMNLFINNYDDYLNVLYRIDVSEKELETIKGASLKENIHIISFLVLKREFQKVWFKNKT